MKIAIELKNKSKDYIIKVLKQKNFNIEDGSFGTIWIYEIRTIYKRIESTKDKLILEGEKFGVEIAINYEDIEYFEIHSEAR